LYASLIVNDCIDLYLKAQKLRVLCKLDIERAFDHVSLDFLVATLEKIGFLASGGDGYSFASLRSTFRY